MYIVYTEIHDDEKVDRLYYARYSDEFTANEAALNFYNEWPVYRCVCSEEDARRLGIHNLPADVA